MECAGGARTSGSRNAGSPRIGKARAQTTGDAAAHRSAIDSPYTAGRTGRSMRTRNGQCQATLSCPEVSPSIPCCEADAPKQMSSKKPPRVAAAIWIEKVVLACATQIAASTSSAHERHRTETYLPRRWRPGRSTAITGIRPSAKRPSLRNTRGRTQALAQGVTEAAANRARGGCQHIVVTNRTIA